MSRRIAFWKLEGAGNDFLGLDGRRKPLGLSREKIAAWCDRQRGAGADGVLSWKSHAAVGLIFEWATTTRMAERQRCVGMGHAVLLC